MEWLTQQDVLAHQAEVPWPSLTQVEQDLLLCRAMASIFNDRFLREQLAMRGGTLLHVTQPSRHHFFALFRCVTPPKAGSTIDFKPSRWQAPFMISGKLGIVGPAPHRACSGAGRTRL